MPDGSDMLLENMKVRYHMQEFILYCYSEGKLRWENSVIIIWFQELSFVVLVIVKVEKHLHHTICSASQKSCITLHSNARKGNISCANSLQVQEISMNDFYMIVPKTLESMPVSHSLLKQYIMRYMANYLIGR